MLWGRAQLFLTNPCSWIILYFKSLLAYDPSRDPSTREYQPFIFRPLVKTRLFWFCFLISQSKDMRQFFWLPNICFNCWMRNLYRVRTGLKITWIYRTVLKSPWKLNLPWKVVEKHSKALKSPWILPFTGVFNTVFGDLNQYKIVV